MWSLIHGLFGTFNGTGYTAHEFVVALSPSSPHYVQSLSVAALTFAIGFIEYIYSFALVRREGRAPYNLLMHSFYFAIDSMGIFVFALAAHQNGGFWLFIAASVAEVVWTLFEIYNLVMCIYVERVEIWGPTVSVSSAWIRVGGWLVVMIVVVNLFRVFMNDPVMLKWYIFTNVLMGIMPSLYWEKRGTRVGASWGLAIVIAIGTINSFTPFNMWSSISPYFNMHNNPWFYVVGVVSIFFSLRAFIVLSRLPAKPRLINGKRAIW